MKDAMLPILIIAIFIGGILFLLLSNENREKAPAISAPQVPSSSSMKASVLDSSQATTSLAN